MGLVVEVELQQIKKNMENFPENFVSDEELEKMLDEEIERMY